MLLLSERVRCEARQDIQMTEKRLLSRFGLCQKAAESEVRRETRRSDTQLAPKNQERFRRQRPRLPKVGRLRLAFEIAVFSDIYGDQV
jgi:hypothetical protein